MPTPSIEAILARHRDEAGGSLRRALAFTSEDEFRAYAQGARASEGASANWRIDDGTTPAMSERQRAALARLGTEALGSLSVRWHSVLSSPVSIDRLAFVRRGQTPEAVWSAFRDSHFHELQDLWGIADPEDLTVTERRPLGADRVVLRGVRQRAGLPVDGDFFEVFVSTERSHLGAGVLTRIQASWFHDPGRLPALPRSSWVTEERARTIAADAVRGQESDAPVSASLHLSCGMTCEPLWRLSWRSNRHMVIDALRGEVTIHFTVL